MLCVAYNCIKLKPLTTCRITRSYASKYASSKGNALFDLIRNFPQESSKTADEVIYSKMSDISVDVLGSGGEGAPPAVAVKVNGTAYLINCGEGTQKLSTEYRLKLSKSANVFVTYPSWRNLSGLLGIMLTLQDNGFPQITIHGHSCIASIFSCVNKFVNLRSLHAEVINCSHDEEYNDDTLSVKYILLHSSSETSHNKLKDSAYRVAENSESECEAELSKEGSCSHSPESENGHKKKEKGKKHKSDVGSKLLQVKLQRPAVSYVFKTKPTPGALNFEKCVTLGVPAGPLLGDLKRGKDITLENGTVVKSKDVLGPDSPGITVIAVECPSEHFLNSLSMEPLFCEYQSGDSIADAVIHFSSPKIVNNLKYQNWIKRFPQATKHLFINKDNTQSGSVAIHRQQYKLHLLDPVLFPLLHDSGIPDFPRKESSALDEGHSLVENKDFVDTQIFSDTLFYKCDTNNSIKGETMCKLHLKPKKMYDYSKCLALKKETFLEEVYQEDVKEKIEKCREELQKLSSKLQSDKRIYPKILFLGTGSGKPSKVRNPSGILIFTEENKCIMFDCGENCYNQLVSFCGKQRTAEILRGLKVIFISHLHVDHHFGLITILKERKLAFDELNETAEESNRAKFEPVVLFAPVQLLRWLKLFSDEFEGIMNLFEVIGNSFMDGPVETIKALLEVAKGSLNLKSITTVPVHHAPNSFGISIVHENGWKITYSGDTRPCETLVDLGMNSDILIHEATFDGIYKEHAKHKLHSTTYEAIDVGKRMQAKYILLTHFSQRYCYIPNIEEEFSQLNIGIAFDFMEVPFNRLEMLPSLLVPLQYILSKYDERVKLTVKTLQMKRERRKTMLPSNRSRSPDEDEKPAKIFKPTSKNHKHKM